ncbi:aldehyde dehydrogenase family protein [Helicobacter muridarum]|uniref:L-glutamate gamma-semialdehyde dehydrogenase n=1 Tax=Helicobacter muridarum TaxID=216 RepID=A0A377PVJ3_9HELI|nr:bifunctional proline dehydrogenase/L-glutamate gamma-semialdehyde dehydrogenase [Helicobacter muridarum]TLE00460.1 aldehyde dehydrogenase family protein [Helicobacter muridarum]STQ86434.1 Proline dehydrogenase [Helicobacter muridarum]
MKDTIKETLHLARKLQYEINKDLSQSEKRFRKRMMKMLENPQSKVMLIELLDRSFRSKDSFTAYEFISHTLQRYGIADFFSSFERILLQSFLGIGKSVPSISVPLFIRNLRNDTKKIVLDEKPISLKKKSDKRKERRIGLNVNLIGEEVLGNLEANYRLQKYEDALNSKYIDYMSIKITTIFSQINILDFEYSKNEIVKRLDKLYDIAQTQKKNGNEKFINLDMEEYKDLELTVVAFMESIAKFDIKAGIVLQAYIPESYEYLKKLVDFSKARVESGKPPIKIRIVKGANMASEETTASIKGWELPTFRHKVDTDSNYNKMLNYVLEDSNFKYINIGIASHNIFQIAYAMTRIRQAGAYESFTFEMLEGMNVRAGLEVSKTNPLILYAPVCSDAYFNNAIAYLVRRLDENTSEDNFMRYSFDLEVNSAAWKQQEQIFLESLKKMESVRTESYRNQNRLQAPFTSKANLETFHNEPDTDFILACNREWANDIKHKYTNFSAVTITPVIGEDRPKNSNAREIKAKGGDNIIGTIHNASTKTIAKAISFLKNAKQKLSFDELGQILLKTAEIIAAKRGDLIGISALEVGKTFLETDPEVSEAIDFLRFYPHSMQKILKEHSNYDFTPKGIGAVITPWNFPVAISVGGIAASIASGNRVIYKPSNLSCITGSMLCECFYEAGLPKEYLVFLPASGKDINELVLPEANFAILTGGEDTAYRILEQNPSIFLSAETGGKNATIVTKMADRDQAAKNIIHSAFSNSGQKCSATSLLILEKEVYEDENFARTLVDAAQSLNVGSPFDFKNKVGYLSDNISEKVKEGLKLQMGEQWVLKPSFVDNNPYAMKPCIKYGVKEESLSHLNEFFAPVLSVMCAKDLDHAIHIANSTGYGLTGGLESLDEREWEHYMRHIKAGNIYINKPTTGAIVLRQPFGGINKSSVGFGRKAGGYNYITQFVDITPKKNITKEIDTTHSNTTFEDRFYHFVSVDLIGHELEGEIKKVLKAIQSYGYYNQNEFMQQRDVVNIRGEDNVFYYVPVKSVIYRVRKEDTLSDILKIIAACEIVNTKLTLSIKATEISKALEFVLENSKTMCLQNVSIDYQSERDFIEIAGNHELIRYLGNLDSNCDICKKLIKEGGAHGKLIANHKPYDNGYFELLYYHTERAASIAFHRYGNLGRKALFEGK